MVWTKKVEKAYAKFPHKDQFKLALTSITRDPYYGANIKRLHGELEGLYRYRLGDYRLIYQIQQDKLILLLIQFASRGSAY